MDDFEIIIGLSMVAVLSSYLFIKDRQRMRSRFERHGWAEWPGKAIDVTPIKPVIEDLRRDYLAARAPTRGIFFHRSLLRLARRTIARMAYFQEREPEEHRQG
jgi:hypothetical protein